MGFCASMSQEPFYLFTQDFIFIQYFHKKKEQKMRDKVNNQRTEVKGEELLRGDAMTSPIPKPAVLSPRGGAQMLK